MYFYIRIQKLMFSGFKMLWYFSRNLIVLIHLKKKSFIKLVIKKWFIFLSFLHEYFEYMMIYVLNQYVF